MFRPLLLLPSPHKKINELETRSASLTACLRIPMMPISHSSGSRSVIPIDPDQCGVA
jgi:hypothetical protein